MAKQCATVIDKQGNIDSVILKNYDNTTPLERAVKRNKGYSLDKASNGEPSLLYQFYIDEMNMSPEEAEFVVANTFSTEFGDWFGRWWEDGADASKVVDTNGQPKPVWSGQLAHSKFDGTYKGYEQNYIEDGYERFSRSAFFLEDKYDALSYATALSIRDEKTLKMYQKFLPQGYHHEPVFLNIKNIKKIDSIGYETIMPLIPESKEKGIDGFEGKTTSAFGTQVNSWVISSGSQVIPLSEKEDLSDQMGVMLQNETGEKINTPVEIIEKVVDKLMDKNLVSKSYILSNDAIINKLKELGISDKIAREIQVWHGSPHSFDKFSTSAMGTGEGAQAFGWGLYFTDLKGIAENYANNLSDYKLVIPSEYKELFNRNLKGIDTAIDMVRAYDGALFITSAISNAIIDLSISIDQMEAKNLQNIEAYQVRKNDLEELKKIDLNTISSKLIEKSRNLYNVSLHEGKTPEQYTWLEWYSTFDMKNIPVIQSIFELSRFHENMLESADNIPYDEYEKLRDEYNQRYNDIKKEYDITPDDLTRLHLELFYGGEIETNEQLYNRLKNILKSAKEASLFLLENGIDGVKYPAESLSRGATSETARGFNYVVFDENAITLNEVIQFNKELSNAGLKPIIGGFFNSQTKEVYLNEDSNDLLISTLHEFSHPMLQWLRDNRRGHFDAGIEVLKNNSEEAQAYIDKVKELYPNLKENSDTFYEEVLATIIGDKGAELIRSKEDSNIQTWLSDLWEMFKDIIGLTEYSVEEVSNMSLQEFSDAFNAEMLNSNAEKSYSLNALESKEFISNRGRNVSKQHIENLIKRQNVKQAERDIMNDVLENIDTTNKISYDQFESAVKASIMPLTLIGSGTYADYGSSNINGVYDKVKTIIFNSPLNHDITGHFKNDYESKLIYFEEIDPKTVKINDDIDYNNSEKGELVSYLTYEDKRGGEIILTDRFNKKYTKKGIFTESEKNDIVNEKNKEIILKRKELEKNSNKGLFGHTRVWTNDKVYNVAEVQSDVFQDKNYILNDYGDPMYDVEVLEKYNNQKTGSDVEDMKIVKKLLDAFEKKSGRTQFRASEKFFELRLIRESLKDAADKGFKKLRLPLPYTLSKIEGYIGENSQVQVEGTPVIGDTVQYLGEDHIIFDHEDGIVYIIKKDNVKNINEEDGYDDVANDIFTKAFENIETTGESYSAERLLIKMNSLDIEVKYSKIITDYLKELKTKKGEEKFYVSDLRDDIVQELSDNISPKDLTDYYEEVFDYSAFIRNDLLYYSNADNEAVSYSSEAISKDDFRITDLAPEHQTVVKRYEVFGKMLQKERGKDNYKIVEDENGYPWYETDILESDRTNPVIAFQIEVQQNEFIPSQLFEELSQQPFMTKEQALDIYQHIYTEGLNEWKDNDMTC